MSYSRTHIRNIVANKNAEAGELKHRESVVTELVEWLRETGGEASWDPARVDADDAALALEIYRVEQEGIRAV